MKSPFALATPELTNAKTKNLNERPLKYDDEAQVSQLDLLDSDDLTALRGKESGLRERKCMEFDCNDLDDDDFYAKPQLRVKRNVCSEYRYHRKVENFLNKMRNHYTTKKDSIRISYAKEPTHKFVCYMTSLYVKEIDRQTASRYTKTNSTNYKYYTEDDNLFIFVTPVNWKPQFMGFDFFQPLTTVISMLQHTRRTASTLLSGDFGLFLLDVVRFLIDLREGYFSVNKILSSFISLFIMHKRYTKMFPQTTTTTDLLIGLAALQLPTCLLDKLKNFALLTGKKVFDNDFILETVSMFFDTIISMLDYIISLDNPLIPTFLAASIKNILSNVGSKFIMYKRMKEVAEIYSSYCRDSTRMFDPVFRQKITELYDKCVGDAVFVEFITNGTNNYFKTTWNLFKENIVKTVTSFESSSRDEPILFIFEGDAGTGKSVIMNMMVDLYRSKGVSVYSHSFPPLVAGKDFWDDYAGQYLMVVDDVAQRAKNELGMIINLVSPVKYPLACANASLKNTKFFSSKLIFMTTNSFMNLGGFTSADGVSCPEALFRRAHVVKVDRISQPGEVFNQRLSYHKFDFRGEKKWVNKLLYHNAGDLPLITETVKDGVADNTAALKFVYRLVSHIERTDEADRKHLVPNQGFYNDIIRSVELEREPVIPTPERIVMTDEEFVDAVEHTNEDTRRFVAQGWADALLIPLVDSYDYIASVIHEAMEFLTIEAKKIWEVFTNIIVDSQAGSTVRDIVFKYKYSLSTALAGGTFLFLIIGILRQFWNREKIDISEVMKVNDKDVDMLKLLTIGDNDRINSIRRFCKTIHIKEDSLDRSKDKLTQAIVSGDKIMFPYHSPIEGKVLDIYTTWDHWLNGHKEMENIEVKLVKSYLSVDIAIYRITKAIPLWKLCHNIFPQQQQNNPLHYLVNSVKTQEVILGLSVVRNDQAVNYTGYRIVNKKNFLGVPYESQELFDISHKPGSGYFTGVSSEGFCGTALCSTDGGIVGFHVAGTPDEVGFVVAPPQDIADDIRKVMTSSRDVKFEIDRRIVPGQSGVRLRYETPMEVRYTGGESSFVKTIFHREYNADIKNLEDSIFHHTTSKTVAPKKPPDFKAMGKPVTLLKKMASKTLSHQGDVTDDELAYIFECLEPMIPYFDDVDDMTVAFGGDGLQPLNKDSSNGYGCLKSKLDYFDFDNKEIKDITREGIERFRKAAEEEDYAPEHFVCIETFKDELRTIPKSTSPRTFRVMPLFHIWWTKKIFGKLIPHFKDNVHNTGICIGLNPYKDFDTIYKKLKPCHIHGDIDFGKWDGSINARIMQTIGEIFLQKYRGKHDYMIKYLFNTMTTSMTMVSDELIATTHGLPSGTWLTLLLNCLLNKSLTALTMYRNWDGIPSYAEFNEIVDYVTGDDKIFGTPHEFRNIINLQTIAEVAKSLGMDCTNGDKTPIVSPHRPLKDLNYVKRDFVYHPQLATYVGALSVDTIMNTLQWYDSKKDLNECIEGKMKSVQVEAYLHSRSFYYSLTNIFKKQFPHLLFFDEEKVKNILKSDSGYTEVMTGLGKDMSFHN